MKVQTGKCSFTLWVKIKKIIIFNSFCILVSASAFLKPVRNGDTSLTSCVVKMVEDIDYKKDYHVMDITVMNINNDLKLSALHKVEGARFISRMFFWNTDNISNMIYIVMSANYQELERGLSKIISDKFWNSSARFIFVLQSYENYSLRDITNLLHAYNIFYKVTLILRVADDYALYKYNFTKPGYCFKTGYLTFWSRCSHFRAEKNLPRQLFKGSIRSCRYKFLSHNFWPFTNFDTSTKGSDQHFITLFEKQYGVKIDLHEFGKIDKYGKVMKNTSVILLQKVVNDEAEGALGGYGITAENNLGNISYSYPMTIDHMIYVVAHSNFVEQWVAVLYQSSQTCVVYGLVFVIFCVLATFLSIFRTRKDISYNILIVFGYLLNKNFVRRTESGWSQTLVFSSLLFAAFIIPYAIQANLCSVTTQPVRGYEPTEPEDLKTYQAVLYTEWQFRNEFKRHWDCGTRPNCLNQVKNSPQKTLYTIISDSHYQAYQGLLTDDQCKMATYRLREPYIPVYRAILLRRGSVLIPYLNSFIIQLSTTGVMSKYTNDVYFRDWLKCKSRHRPDHAPLPLSDFYCVFMILIGGYCLSLLVFICEVWVGLQCKIPTRKQLKMQQWQRNH